MTLRPLTAADYPALYDFWLHTPGMGLNNLDDSAEGIARYLRRNPTTCFGAWEDGRLAGAILAGHDGRRGFLYHTALLPEFRRRGIGTALVQAALDALRAEGIHKTALVVFARNEEGNAFWETLGFTTRPDLCYRNRTLDEMVRIDT